MENMNNMKADLQNVSYSSLLTKPVPFGSKSLKAASMVSSGSVPGGRQSIVEHLIRGHHRKIKDLFERLWKSLTVEFLPKKTQEHGEVDWTLPLIQHPIQLLIADIKFPWYTQTQMLIHSKPILINISNAIRKASYISRTF